MPLIVTAAILSGAKNGEDSTTHKVDHTERVGTRPQSRDSDAEDDVRHATKAAGASSGAEQDEMAANAALAELPLSEWIFGSWKSDSGCSMVFGPFAPQEVNALDGGLSAFEPGLSAEGMVVIRNLARSEVAGEQRTFAYRFASPDAIEYLDLLGHRGRVVLERDGEQLVVADGSMERMTFRRTQDDEERDQKELFH